MQAQQNQNRQEPIQLDIDAQNIVQPSQSVQEIVMSSYRPQSNQNANHFHQKQQRVISLISQQNFIQQGQTYQQGEIHDQDQKPTQVQQTQSKQTAEQTTKNIRIEQPYEHINKIGFENTNSNTQHIVSNTITQHIVSNTIEISQQSQGGNQVQSNQKTVIKVNQTANAMSLGVSLEQIQQDLARVFPQNVQEMMNMGEEQLRALWMEISLEQQQNHTKQTHPGTTIAENVPLQAQNVPLQAQNVPIQAQQPQIQMSTFTQKHTEPKMQSQMAQNQKSNTDLSRQQKQKDLIELLPDLKRQIIEMNTEQFNAFYLQVMQQYKKSQLFIQQQRKKQSQQQQTTQNRSEQPRKEDKVIDFPQEKGAKQAIIGQYPHLAQHVQKEGQMFSKVYEEVANKAQRYTNSILNTFQHHAQPNQNLYGLHIVVPKLQEKQHSNQTQPAQIKHIVEKINNQAQTQPDSFKRTYQQMISSSIQTQAFQPQRIKIDLNSIKEHMIQRCPEIQNIVNKMADDQFQKSYLQVIQKTIREPSEGQISQMYKTSKQEVFSSKSKDRQTFVNEISMQNGNKNSKSFVLYHQHEQSQSTKKPTRKDSHRKDKSEQSGQKRKAWQILGQLSNCFGSAP